MEGHLRTRPELLPAVLTTLFELVLFEDVGNQWSLSRPMLALILVNEVIYLELQRQIIAAQPSDRWGFVAFGGPRSVDWTWESGRAKDIHPELQRQVILVQQSHLLLNQRMSAIKVKFKMVQ